MITMMKMHFYVTKTPNNLYHVQNYVGAYRGQHHVHSEESYLRWIMGLTVKEYEDIEVKLGECSCGLNKSGMVREYDGREWFNDRFEKEETK